MISGWTLRTQLEKEFEASICRMTTLVAVLAQDRVRGRSKNMINGWTLRTQLGKEFEASICCMTMLVAVLAHDRVRGRSLVWTVC